MIRCSVCNVVNHTDKSLIFCLGYRKSAWLGAGTDWQPGKYWSRNAVKCTCWGCVPILFLGCANRTQIQINQIVQTIAFIVPFMGAAGAAKRHFCSFFIGPRQALVWNHSQFVSSVTFWLCMSQTNCCLFHNTSQHNCSFICRTGSITTDWHNLLSVCWFMQLILFAHWHQNRTKHWMSTTLCVCVCICVACVCCSVE